MVTRNVKTILEHEARRTRPDYIVYVPRHFDGSENDSLNEHFLVFDGPDGSLMAIWVQSPLSQQRCNRIMFSTSADEGGTWSAPARVAGPMHPGDEAMASWAFPIVSKSGRIYVLYSRNTLEPEGFWIHMHCGRMEGVYSDDYGKTWSSPQSIPMPESPFDDPQGIIPPEWIVWQKPMRDLSGGYIVGYTHWFNPAKSTFQPSDRKGWTWIDSVAEFMRFTNIDNNPEPSDLLIQYNGWGEEALRIPHYLYPHLSTASEPSLVRLPDESLFCVMRSCTGYIWWSRSADDGRTWTDPRPLLNRDHGLPMLNPVVTDPIFRLSDGRYILFYFNTNCKKEAEASEAFPRAPLFSSIGTYKPDACQPIWFEPPVVFADTNGYRIDGQQGELGVEPAGMSVYGSFTNRKGVDILWYPDRKSILLGRRILP